MIDLLLLLLLLLFNLCTLAAYAHEPFESKLIVPGAAEASGLQLGGVNSANA